MKRFWWLLSAGLLTLILIQTGQAAEPASLAPVETILSSAELQAGQLDSIRPAPDGLTAAPTGGTLTTAPQEAARFSDILLAWEARMPVSATLEIELRVSADGQRWQPWGHVEENDDLSDERDGPDQHWGAPLFAGQARWWQARISFGPAPDGTLPTLLTLRASTVDVGQLPVARPQSSAPTAPNAIARPPVVSRTQWGSEDGQSSRVPPAYYPVNHLVVHHTADPNTLGGGESWWGDRVRAIWVFHTYTRGWGDIGYNFLIAPDGSVFEGRAGGDNAVGFHDTGNYGSMGVALIGTYSSTAPPAAAQNILVELLAWKAQQRSIDPLGSSYYYGCDISRYCGNAGAITPNIAGHRQVANKPVGYTSCPGDSTFNLLPTIRTRVQARLGGASDNGDLTIDDLESSFIRSAATWHEASCGDGGHIFYTYATDSAADSTNSGIWRKEGLDPDSYQIYVHIPQNCPLANRTQRARYTVWQNGQQIAAKIVSQQTSTEWIEITPGPLAMSGVPVEVHLTDLTDEPLNTNREIIFDTVRWVRVVPQASVSLESVSYGQTTIAGGELLQVTYRLRNTGNVTLQTQDPLPGLPGDGTTGYTYDEGECFAGNPGSSYPAFPKESGRIRLLLGAAGDGISIDCSAESGGYPWRWGLGGPLEPGAVRELVGYVRFRNPGTSNRSISLKAGVINEYVSYLATDQGAQIITVTPERSAPQSVVYSSWQPLAQVSTLGVIPADFLARTANPASIPTGTPLGAFAWDGQRIDWGLGGPFNQTDMFVIEQTRMVVAPISGIYQFRTTSDDGSWLWINGSLVAEAHGLHPEREASGQIWLPAGEHVLSYKYFERSSAAVSGYDWQPAGGSGDWQPIPVTVGGGVAYAGGYFGPGMRITLGADDLGGSGVDYLRWSLNSGPWNTVPGNRLTVTSGSGAFTLQYQAVDKAGNVEPVRSISWQVDGTPPVSQLSLAGVEPSGLLRLALSTSDSGSGTAAVRIEVRDTTLGEGWRLWTVTTQSSPGFFGLPGHSYAFRSQALDRVGNEEPLHSSADTTGSVPAVTSFYQLALPMVVR